MNLQQKKIIFLALFVIGNLNAFWPFDGNNECATVCDNRLCGSPLYCDAVDIQLQAGAVPIIWKHREGVQTGSLFFSPTTPILTVFESPRFGRLFNLAWIVGGQIGYAWDSHVRVYFESNYLQAHGKSNVSISTATTPAVATTLSLNSLKMCDVYVGARYYWDRWCDQISFFLGGKIGFTHHYNTHLDIAIGIPPFAGFNPLSEVEIFSHNTVMSGGITTGFDFCFCNNWAFVITGEIVFSAGQKINRSIPLIPAILGRFTALSFGNMSLECRFPITAGVRYSF